MKLTDYCVRVFVCFLFCFYFKTGMSCADQSPVNGK